MKDVEFFSGTCCWTAVILYPPKPGLSEELGAKKHFWVLLGHLVLLLTLRLPDALPGFLNTAVLSSLGLNWTSRQSPIGLLSTLLSHMRPAQDKGHWAQDSGQARSSVRFQAQVYIQTPDLLCNPK